MVPLFYLALRFFVHEWAYKPAVELRFSVVDKPLSLIITRDMGYSKGDGDQSTCRPYDPVGDWSFSTTMPMNYVDTKEVVPALPGWIINT